MRMIKRDDREYVKGYEVRFVAASDEELDLIRNSLFALNYRLNKGFFKRSSYIQPLYNKALTLRYKKLRDKLRGRI